MKDINGCFNRITTTFLIVLLALSLICTISFWLEEWLNLNNPIMNALWHIYWDVYTVWISVVVAFLNILCACTGIQLTYKVRKAEKKPLINCIVYAGISLLVFVIHCITSDYIFGSVVISV